MDYEFLYGAQYYRAPTPGRDHWASDLERMARCGFNAVKFWAQWRWASRQPDSYYFADLDELMDLAAANRLSVTINTIFDVAPGWLYLEFPDCKMVRADGLVLEPRTVACRQIGGAPGPCYNHPEAARARVDFLENLASRYANHAAMGMWDVWNEPEWCISLRDPREESLLCYCENCRSTFVAWLRNRYGSVSRLNEVWGRCYSAWEDVELPRDRSTFSDMIDWRLFCLDTMAAEAQLRIETVKKIDSCHPVYLHPVPNTLTCFNTITGVDDFQMARLCDCFAGTTNGVPESALQTVSAASGRVCYNVESHLRYGSTAMLPRRLNLRDFADCFVPQIGLGIRGFLHWQYRGETLGLEAPAWGLLDANGSPGTTHEAAAEFWRRLQPHARRLMTAPLAEPEVAIYKSSAGEIFHWCVQGTFDELAGGIDAYTRALYDANARLAYANDAMLTEGLPESIRLLVLPNSYALTQLEADALAAWVAKGGVLLCEAHTGAYDLTTGRHSGEVPGLGLAAAFGLREINTTAAAHLGTSSDYVIPKNWPADVRKAIEAYGCTGGPLVPLVASEGGHHLLGWSRYAEMEGNDLETLACLPDCHACVVSRRVGLGCVIYAGTLLGGRHIRPEDPGFGWLIRKALDAADIPSTETRWPGMPKGVRLDLLPTIDGAAIAASNRTDASLRFSLPSDEPLVGLYTEQTGAQVALDAGQADLFVPSRW